MTQTRECKTCKKTLSINDFGIVGGKSKGYRRLHCLRCYRLSKHPNPDELLKYWADEKEKKKLLANNLKICTICKITKPLDEFNNLKNGLGGKNCKCRKCSKQSWNEHWTENREELLKKGKENSWERKTPEEKEKSIKEKEYRTELHFLQEQGKRRCRMCDEIKVLDDFSNGSDKCFYNKSAHCKKCAHDTWRIPYRKLDYVKAKKKIHDKKYNLTHKVETNARARKNYHDPLNLQYKLKINLRSRLGTMLRKYDTTKTESALKLVGCDLEFLKQYLENQFKKGMSWNNWSMHGWHIDHIIPLDAFDLTILEEQKKAFHYTNLQPLWAIENLQKGNRII